MIGDFCALYIPLGEAFMFLPILPIATFCTMVQLRIAERVVLRSLSRRQAGPG